MKKTAKILISIILYGLCIILFSGYGHTETHVPLNTSIALRFLEMINTGQIFDAEKFKNYEFNWNTDHQPKLNGPAITGDFYTYYTESDESDLSYTPVEWIANGGWMEDEPWGPAAICHFYDPVGIDGGKKYLTDNSGNLEWAIKIPKEWLSRDAKSWATGYENKYGWRKAKEYVVKALQEGNVAIRNNYMAMAYRSLGQTLHLVADMGCPPHVRNDSHPPKVSFLVGDPDPYEDICKNLDTYTLVKANPPSSRVKSSVSGTEKFDEVMESLAVFTNSNFFSGQTITTDRFRPVVRPDNPYPSPVMSEVDYNSSDFTYYKIIDGVKVKMCRDKTSSVLLSLLGAGDLRGKPYLDKECVESMASVLMPNVVEAGANVIRLFIPSLKIEITEATADNGGVIKGKVYYTLPSSDDEYSGLFKTDDLYNGPVSLFINGKESNIKVNAVHNKFEFRLDGKVTDLKQGDVVQTKIDFGGIALKSESRKLGGNDYLKIIQSFRNINISFNMDSKFSSWTDLNFSGAVSGSYIYYTKTYVPISWDGGNFSFVAKYTNPDPRDNRTRSYECDVKGYISDDLILKTMTVTSKTMVPFYDILCSFTYTVADIKLDFYNPSSTGAGSGDMDLNNTKSPNGRLVSFVINDYKNGDIKVTDPNTQTMQLRFFFGANY